jgi:Endonuclease/Exonuclease/phosphatase family
MAHITTRRPRVISCPAAVRRWVGSIGVWFGVVGCVSRSQPAPTIVTDGRFDEWRDVPVILQDSADAPPDAAVDLGAVQVVDDPRFLHLTVTLGRVVNAQAMRGTVRILFDADGKRGTGATLRGLRGTDFILELSRRDDPRRGAMGAGVGVRAVTRDAITPIRSGYLVDALVAPTHSATEFEIRIARGRQLDEGPPIFSGSSLRMRLVFEDARGIRDETRIVTYHMRTHVAESHSDSIHVDLNKAAGAFRVVQWNVADATIFASPDPFRRILAALEPDVLLLDEVFGNVSRSELERFFETPPLGTLGEWRFVMSRSGGRQKTVVASRLPIVREERLATVNYASGAIDRLEQQVNDPRFQRLFSLERERGVPATGAWVTTRQDDVERPILFVPLDLQSGGYDGSGEDQLRELQAATIGDQVVDVLRRRRDTPAVIVGGDFNLVGSDRPLHDLRQRFANINTPMDVVDPYRLTGQSQVTWRGRADDPFTPGCLDFIVFTAERFEVVRSFVFDTDEIPRAMQIRLGLEPDDSRSSSDHLPVVADFRWRP